MVTPTAKAITCCALAFLGSAGAYHATSYAFWPVFVCAFCIVWVWEAR